MNRIILPILAAALIWLPLVAQSTITLSVIDDADGSPVRHAMIEVDATGEVFFTDGEGRRDLPAALAGQRVFVYRLGFERLATVLSGEEGAAVIRLSARPIPVEDLVIEADAVYGFNPSEVHREDIERYRPKDVGEFFKSQPGFGAIRRGGYAIDPQLRGFKYEQLNVQFDGGTQVTHACPNRMDPVTTHVQTEDIEKIEIIRGPYSMRYGQTMGGVINLVMKRPTHTPDLAVHGEVESGYESNGEGRRARAALSLTHSRMDLHVSGGTKDYGDYENGDGTVIPSAFRVNDYSARLGLQPARNQRIQFGWRQSFARDIFHAGLPMDTRVDDTDMWTVDYAWTRSGNAVSSVSAKLYGSQVDHVMDNRQRPNRMMVAAVSTVESNTYGGRVEVGLAPRAGQSLFLGADLRDLGADGSRERLVKIMNGMPLDPPRAFTDAVWQDSRLTTAGLFGELNQRFGSRVAARFGARMDRSSSAIDDPAVQFTERYGDIGTREETTISATVGLDYRLTPETRLTLALGRGARAANLTERYINHMTVGVDAHEYVGNPFLDPEINHQVDLTLHQVVSRHFVVEVTGFYSRISDFITAAVDESIPRLYMPMNEPRFAKRFQNIDRARQVGFELQVSGAPLPALSYRGSLSYTRGDNLDWDEPLPEIQPLEGKLSLRYRLPAAGAWVEGEGRWVADQERVAASFAETRTPGFAVYNLRGGLAVWNSVELSAAVLNLFDRTYVEHLNRAFVNMAVDGMLYEPGRSVMVNVTLRR